MQQMSVKLNGHFWGAEPHQADGALLLAYEIVAFAVDDWRKLIRRKAWKKSTIAHCNFRELRKFFRSEWCMFLLQGCSIEPKEILARLEEELQAAKEKE